MLLYFELGNFQYSTRTGRIIQHLEKRAWSSLTGKFLCTVDTKINVVLSKKCMFTNRVNFFQNLHYEYTECKIQRGGGRKRPLQVQAFINLKSGFDFEK